MAKKHESHEPENHERWLVSYADFITLLFAFFVVMFASSQTDKARAKQVSEAVQKALDDGHSFSVPSAVAKVLGGTVDDVGQGNAMMKGPGGVMRALKEAPPEEVVELMPSLARLNKDLEREVREGKLEIRLEPRGLVISLRQSAFFPSGTDDLDPATFPAMKKMAEVIGALPNSIQLEGHTDAVPIHNARFKSNWELSCARAIAVLETFSDTFGLPRERFSVVGRADTFPIDSNDTPEGRARNRRVDIVIMNALKVRPNDPNTKSSPAQPGQAQADLPKPSPYDKAKP
jgi:chemotaxis protein MotB